jgi:hypothetical protein
MAKLNEDAIVIKISELCRDDQPMESILDSVILEQLQAVIQELVGPNRLIEIIRD